MARDLLEFTMQNFQGMIFKRIQTYTEISNLHYFTFKGTVMQIKKHW